MYALRIHDEKIFSALPGKHAKYGSDKIAAAIDNFIFLIVVSLC